MKTTNTITRRVMMLAHATRRVDDDKLTVNIGKGIISSGYLEELEAFLAPYNLKITTGRVTVAL